jgi:hypothetical protein
MLLNLLNKWRPTIPSVPNSPTKTLKASQAIIKKYGEIMPCQPPEQENLHEIYKIICDNYLSNTLNKVSVTHIVNVPWILFNYEIPLNLGQDPTFFYKFSNLEILNNNKVLKKIVYYLWINLLLRYPLKSPTFNLWCNFIIKFVNSINFFRFQQISDLNTKFNLLSMDGINSCADEIIQGSDFNQSFKIRQINGLLKTGKFAQEVFIGCLSKIHNMICHNIDLSTLKLNLNKLTAQDDLFITVSSSPKDIINPLLLPFLNDKDKLKAQKYKNIIKSFLLDYFGDPRFDFNIKWVAIDKPLLNIIRSWLNNDDMDLFFKVIELSSDERWEERKKFWFKYFDNNYIDNVWPILGSVAKAYAKDNLQNHLSSKSISMAKADDPMQVPFGSLYNASRYQSVLLLRIGNITIAEWSHEGACRIWKQNNNNKPKFYKSGYHGSIDLKSPSDVWLAHTSSWQNRLEQAIYELTNIYPIR